MSKTGGGGRGGGGEGGKATFGQCPKVSGFFLGMASLRVIPCQRFEKKGQRQKVDFFKGNVKDTRAN